MRDILIVEDGQPERERLEQLFRERGFSVVACASVSEAERTLQLDSFRLALLDIGLSDRSGSYLFSAIKRSGRVPQIVIFTGNPSVHLKQRFMDEGATDYIVKGSLAAQNDNLIRRIEELIGAPQKSSFEGIALDDFLARYVTDRSRKLFLESDGSYPGCGSCKSKDYVVTFSHQAQLPPNVQGQVVCAQCGKPMDPEVG